MNSKQKAPTSIKILNRRRSRSCSVCLQKIRPPNCWLITDTERDCIVGCALLNNETNCIEIHSWAGDQRYFECTEAVRFCALCAVRLLRDWHHRRYATQLCKADLSHVVTCATQAEDEVVTRLRQSVERREMHAQITALPQRCFNHVRGRNILIKYASNDADVSSIAQNERYNFASWFCWLFC